ncbi:hypothetical protein [Mycolicibacterium rhodesiae]|uniref:hypothetical protein n=1 Tax=Mycolicibacterium rhodesiae TaxID=36814 RepID=UPI0002E076A1|nr:hypothetical protein [Mycolicibacterium rhodesiae]
MSVQHYPVSTWRGYDKLRRLPAGLLVIGDAMCSLNPMWGQGMTSSALLAMVLHVSGVLRRGSAAAPLQWRRQEVAPIWRGLDFSVAPADDWTRAPKRLVNRIADKVWSAAETGIVLTETFVRTIESLDPITIWIQGRPR